MKPSRNAATRRDRLVEICESFPDVQVTVLGRRKEHRSFLYYLYDHHDDGRIALWCKAGPGEQGRLVEDDSRRFFVPPYVGPKGWVGVRLDLRSVDWTQVAYLVRNAYRLTASRAQIARME